MEETVEEDLKSIKDLTLLALALICLLVSLILQPWAELGFTGKFPPWLAWAMDPLHIAKIFTWLGETTIAKNIHAYLTAQGAVANNFGDYAYALFLFVALIAGAVAIVLIGREDAEEKTVLPVKK